MFDGGSFLKGLADFVMFDVGGGGFFLRRGLGLVAFGGFFRKHGDSPHGR